MVSAAERSYADGLHPARIHGYVVWVAEAGMLEWRA